MDHLETQILEGIIKDSIAVEEDIEGRQIEFAKQLGEFAADTTYKQYLSNCEVRDKIGIEVFKFKPNKAKNVKLYTAGLSGFALSGDVEESTHVAKIVKLPSNTEVVRGEYKEGDLVLLNIEDTVGEEYNPQYVAIMRDAGNSNMAPVLPDGIQKRVHKIASRFFPYALVPPFDYNLKAEYISTFAVPEHFIIGKYTL